MNADDRRLKTQILALSYRVNLRSSAADFPFAAFAYGLAMHLL